jgi:hypothetical protein
MPPHARAAAAARGHHFAADMERPLSSLSMLGRFRSLPVKAPLSFTVILLGGRSRR